MSRLSNLGKVEIVTTHAHLYIQREAKTTTMTKAVMATTSTLAVHLPKNAMWLWVLQPKTLWPPPSEKLELKHQAGLLHSLRMTAP